MNYDCYELRMAVVKEHEKLFPKANLYNQNMSYDEEYAEMISSVNEDLTAEYADMFIAGAGVSRFANNVGHTLCLLVWNQFDPEHKQELIEAVLNKMEVNKRREWVFKRGCYFRKRMIECPNCGTLFSLDDPRQKFCSPKCRCAFNRRKYQRSEKGKSYNHEYYLTHK